MRFLNFYQNTITVNGNYISNAVLSNPIGGIVRWSTLTKSAPSSIIEFTFFPTISVFFCVNVYVYDGPPQIYLQYLILAFTIS